MWERLKPSIRHKLIPVFHYGEDFSHLRKWLDYRHPDGSKVEYVGLAISLEGVTKERIAWGRQAMKVIAESTNPNVKTHAFGVGVKAVLEHIDVGRSVIVPEYIAAYFQNDFFTVLYHVADWSLMSHFFLPIYVCPLPAPHIGYVPVLKIIQISTNMPVFYKITRNHSKTKVIFMQ